jgi:hypothetical protein
MDDVVAVVNDLFFQSRVSSAARASGRTVRFVANEAALEDVGDFRLAVVDLDAGPFVLAAIEQLEQQASGQVIAFGPHVDTELRKAARAAGADRVLAKSKFVTALPHILSGLVTE